MANIYYYPIIVNDRDYGILKTSLIPAEYAKLFEEFPKSYPLFLKEKNELLFNYDDFEIFVQQKDPKSERLFLTKQKIYYDLKEKVWD